MAQQDDNPIRLALTLAGARPMAVGYLADRVRQELQRPSERDPTATSSTIGEAVERLRAAHAPLFAEDLREDPAVPKPDPWEN